MKKFLKYCLFILPASALLVILVISCDKEMGLKDTPTKTYSDASIMTGPGSEGIMEFAPETPNPYTIENMQAALIELHNQNSLDCDVSLFNIRVTHTYIRFEPQDSIQFGMLIQDSSLVLFDYPMDRRIIKGGTYYRNTSLPEGQLDYQWTCVPVGKLLPANVPHVVLSELYLPEEDPELVQYYDTEFDDCITLLIDQALKRTGNYDTLNYTGAMTNGGVIVTLKKTSKWTPSGRIRLKDDNININIGLRGVKVRANRWFETRESLTDVFGNFNILHEFRYPVNYSIKWERHDYNIRSGRHGQAYFNGPKQTGAWNLDIVSGLSWFYGQVHRGAFDYYYNNPTGLRTPPTNGFLGSRIAIGVIDETSRAHYDKRQRNWFGPEIFMYTSGTDFEGNTYTPSSFWLYKTTIHELAHASHFNISHPDYRNTDAMVKESWAIGVAWSFYRLKYPDLVTDEAASYQEIRLQNCPDGIDVVNWGERKYTPLVIDLIDNYNQRFRVDPGNLDYPIDNVTGYTIRNIEDALVNKRTMNDWRDALKINKPTGVTNAQIDELFLNYTPLQ